MKASNLKKIIFAGLAFAGLALTPTLRADVEVFLEGGSASQSVLYDRATNFFAGGSLTVVGGGSSAVAQFSGTSTNPAVSGYGTITIDINVNNGAIDGLQALVSQSPGPADTNYSSGPLTPQVPTFVDSATTPDVVGISSANLYPLPTYVVPLVYRQEYQFRRYRRHYQSYPAAGGDFGNLHPAGNDLLWGNQHQRCLLRRTKQ